MTQIVLVSDNKETISQVEKILGQVVLPQDEQAVEDIVKNELAGIILFDCDSKELDAVGLIRKLKLTMQTKDMRSVILLNENKINYDVLKYANNYITKPIDEELFKSTINSSLQLRDTFRVLSKNNNDLAKSLYQLNVLYNTSTQLAGSLDKTKLIDIMTDGLEQSLSLSLCYALILNEVNDIQLIIKSVFPLSSRLENAIKLRALLNFKNLFSLNPSIEDIKEIKKVKDQYGEYDLNVFNFDNLFAPINIKNKFYGIIEVFRENDFAQDDTKCFTTLVKQVSLPLESAILYEEIKDTNIKLEKLERLKSEFISIVSHELRTPLTSINSALDIILKGTTGEINETMEKFLNLAKRNVTRLSAIIYDLLDLSKIEAGKMEFRFEKTNINLPIELVKNTLENLAKEQNITINMEIDNSIEPVYIDTQRMEQVLTNLISNAIKFTRENGTIEIKSSRIKADEIRNNPFFDNLPTSLSEEYVKIAVKDNGIGIAKEDWGKVFEQFKQIENSLSRKVGGSGLGLPIAKRLMQAHKGFIWLDSELDKGSTFYLAIPLMSEKEIFIHSLEQDIQRAKQEHINVSIMALQGKEEAIDKVINEGVIRKTANFKEHSCINNDRKYYYCYVVDLDSFVYDFEVRKLSTFVAGLNKENPDYDIMYSSALCPQDGEEINILIEKLSEFSKGDIDEKSTNS
ncbi:MAG: hypothetical protein E7Z90_02035 [Cyanobacteria bacterium SIG29]|nr:hypothetical protein [Cyanobacteria bacterium SIG29]